MLDKIISLKSSTGLIIYFGMFCNFYFSQNIVPNPDFENYSAIPNARGAWSLCNDWNSTNSGLSYPIGSPDYFHTQSSIVVGLPNNTYSYVLPFSGDAVFGIVAKHQSNSNFREYLSCKLNSQLQPGEDYKISFWITNGESGHYFGHSVNKLGIHFSTNPLSQVDDQPIPVTPQLEINSQLWSTTWTQISFIYTPSDSYEYITIGNFRNDASTIDVLQQNTVNKSAYYYLDMIEVIPLTIITIAGDAETCFGDSAKLTAKNDTVFAWANSLSPSTIISTDSVLTILPEITTTYLVYGSDDTASHTITVKPLPIVDLGNDTIICTNDSLLIDVSEPNTAYLWQDNSTNSSYNIKAEGAYWVSITTNGCTNSDTLRVNYNPLPEVNLGNDTVICEETKLLLDASYPDARYLWHNDSRNATYTAEHAGLSSVEVITSCGSVKDSILIQTLDCSCSFYIPNSFTPNNDGYNDLFKVVHTCKMDYYELTIFNRWGEQIFNSTNIEEPWDGTCNQVSCPTGSYTYNVIYKTINGLQKLKQGNVVLLR